MIAWFTIQRLKMIGIGLVVLAALWWHRHAVVQSYRQGTQDGETQTLKNQAEKLEADTAARRAELDARSMDLDVQQANVDGQRAALSSARAGINNTLQAGLSQLAAQGVDTKNEIQSVPDDAVNGRYRLALERARNAERERATHP